MRTRKFCPHCLHELKHSRLRGAPNYYVFDCPRCEEDFYHFEVYNRNDLKKIEAELNMKIRTLQGIARDNMR